jgi:tetratricopeptide (TPR) repeat protein
LILKIIRYKTTIRSLKDNMADKQQRHELKTKEKAIAFISSFLEKNKKFLIILLAVIVAAIIITAVISLVNEKKENIAAEAVEQLQEKYDKWIETEEDSDERATLETDILEKSESIAIEYGSTFAAQRALFIAGNLYFQKKDWTTAAENFIKAGRLKMDSYLAPITMMLAASAYENSENFSEALDLYTEVYGTFGDTYPDAPRALLGEGRLNEELGNRESAVEAYNEMLDKFPNSGWTDFAQTRLIQLGE